MKWNLDDLPVFLSIVEQGGISVAANILGMPKSTVSTTLSRLERSLGVRLIDRSSRNLRITTEGEFFYKEAKKIVEQALITDTRMADLATTPKGRLRVALPPAFCEEFVVPHLLNFQLKHPEIDLEIIITSQGIELIRDQVDIAVVVGQLEDSELISLPLIHAELIWVTSPKWMSKNSIPCTVSELSQHIQICETRYALRRLPVNIDKNLEFLDLSHGVMKINHPLIIRNMLINGEGISMLPRHYCVDSIFRGKLIQVLTHFKLRLSSSQLTAIYSSKRLMSPRIRVFLEFLKTILV